MKIVKLLLVFCLFHFALIAQQNFEPGYIIHHDRDTVKGYIKTAVEEDLNVSIRFKKEINGELKVYAPAELLGFGMDNEVYRSMQFNNTTDGNRKDTLFVRQLISGEYNLFTYLKSTRRFFLLQKDTSIYLLYDESFRNSGEVEQLANYQNYLNFISVPCESLKNKYTQISYDEKSISDFVLATNNCISGGSSRSFYQKQKAVLTPIVFAGGLPISGQENQITANFTLRVVFPHIDEHTSLNIGVNYSNTTYMMAYSKSLNSNYQYYTKEQITSIPFTVQYNVTQGRVQPYFYLGFSYAHITKDNLGSGYWVQPNENYYGFCLVGGLGIEAKIVSGLYIKADWRYELFMQYPAIGVSYHF